MAADLADALRWIAQVLNDLAIPHQVVGGLAARAYGSTRPVADIDLYVSDEAALGRLASACGEHLRRPPERHRDEHWDLTFLELRWNGWSVEAAAASTARVWDRRTREWAPAGIRFEDSEVREVEGVRLPVMPKLQLVDYKAGLGREVDRLDLAALERPQGEERARMGRRDRSRG